MNTNTVIELAQNGQLKKVPKELITNEVLASKCKSGAPTISSIITHGQLKYVPKELLTDEILNQKGLIGNTGYMLAAKTPNQFKEIPKSLLSSEKLKETQNKEKLWGILIRSRNIKHILPFINELIDDTELGNGSTPPHACATICQLNKIPKDLITEERLLKTKTCGNQNVFHYAAHFGCLDQIPKEFLTQENMSTTDEYGETPIHAAADGNKLHLVPREFLTQENLEKEDNWGTVFHKGAFNCNLDTFPKKLLTEKNLTAKGLINYSPILTLAQICSEPNTRHSQDKKNKALDQFSKLIKYLSINSIKKIVSESKQRKWEVAIEVAKKELANKEILERLANTKKCLTL